MFVGWQVERAKREWNFPWSSLKHSPAWRRIFFWCYLHDVSSNYTAEFNKILLNQHFWFPIIRCENLTTIISIFYIYMFISSFEDLLILKCCFCLIICFSMVSFKFITRDHKKMVYHFIIKHCLVTSGFSL